MNTFLRNCDRSFYPPLQPSYIHANRFYRKRISSAYLEHVKKYPMGNPLWMTVDFRCFNFFKRYRAFCLFFPKNEDLSMYDFSFCYRREIWVLYIAPNDQTIALALGHRLQLAGAHIIKVIAFDRELAGSN